MTTAATVTKEKVETWAIVELMGHTRLIGRVGESPLCPGLIRVDVLDTAGNFQYTKHIGSAAVYAISEIGESEAKAMASRFVQEPTFAYQIKQTLLSPRSEDDDDDDFYPDDDD